MHKPRGGTTMTTEKTRNDRVTKYILMVGAIFAIFALFVGLAGAAPVNPNTLSVLSSSKGNVSSTLKNASAEAGNVSELSFVANSITNAWQGYFGNISGQIILADSLGNNFYTWNNSLPRGEIFASRNSSPAWATINCTNSTGLTNENAFLDKQPTDADSVNLTFSSTSHPAFSVGSVPLANCFSTQAYGTSGPSGQDFWNVLLSDADGAGNIVYTTMINKSATGFRNTATDFELLVGENGNATEAASTTTYYFFVELD